MTVLNEARICPATDHVLKVINSLNQREFPSIKLVTKLRFGFLLLSCKQYSNRGIPPNELTSSPIGTTFVRLKECDPLKPMTVRRSLAIDRMPECRVSTKVS